MRRPRNQFPAWDSIPVQAIAEASLFRFSKRSARRGWEWPLNWFCAVRPSGDPESNPEALLLLLPPSLVGLGAPHGPCLRSPAPGGGKRSAKRARARDARLRCAALGSFRQRRRQRWPSLSVSSWKLPPLSPSQISEKTTLSPSLAGAGNGEARRIIDSIHGPTSGADGGRLRRMSITLPSASISVSTIATPYSSGAILPWWTRFGKTA